MSITYPLDLPTTIGLASIQMRAKQAVSTSQSPFTFKQQVVAHQGNIWEASVTIPPVKRDLAAPWQAFLLALRGKEGSFLLGDPNGTAPRGTVSACTLTGSTGNQVGTVTMTGTLLAGDYIQLGTGSSAKLHMVVQDQSGNGSLDIWPPLRQDYTDETVVYEDAKGLFRLASNVSGWDINNSEIYGISFECVEVLT